MGIWFTPPGGQARTVMETVVERLPGSYDMLTPSLLRKLLPILLVTFLVAPWTSAATPRPADDPKPARTLEANPLEVFSRIWTFLRQRIDPPGTATQTKAGCNIDPDGRCLP